MNGRKHTRTTRLKTMLRCPNGAIIDAICRALGWPARAVQAALCTLRRTDAAVAQRAVERDGQPVTHHTDAELELRS